MVVVRSPQDVYAKHVSSSRGYPLWTPEPSASSTPGSLSSHRPLERGLKIGDVGVVVPENGRFEVLFNLCLSKDLPPSREATGVPDFSGGSSTPIVLGNADVETVLNAEIAGQVVTASPVETTVGHDQTGQLGSADYSFTPLSSSSEGALLVLPEGADRHDARDLRPFFERASRDAAAWYRFAEEKLGRIISHDAIYVITGFDKARAWGIATYQNGGANGDVSARFASVGAREGGGENAAARYIWETTRNVDWRVSQGDGVALPNQSVFVRGFKIALRSHVRGVPRFSRVEGGATGENGRVHHETGQMAGTSSVFHPLDVINQYILEKEPAAEVAVTHDNDWSSLLDQGLLKPEELVERELLAKAVSERYTITLEGGQFLGVAHLESKSGSDSPVSTTTTRGYRAASQSPPLHPESLSVVSESNYRCVDDSTSGSISSASCSVDFQRIPSNFAAVPSINAPRSDQPRRPIKIIVISDYVCAFCYICEKILHDAIEACRDLPVHFDLECRPFVLVSPSVLAAAGPDQVIYRNAYLAKKYGKEKTEMKLIAVDELAQKVGLKFARDSIICDTTAAHRLSIKAYQVGGYDLQSRFNMRIFDACLTRGLSVDDEDLLVDAAVSVGLMNKEEAIEFLHSTEYLDCVEKMVKAARAQGINGVPFVIIDGKWAVNGLQSVECFVQIFHKLAQLPAPSLVRRNSKIERESKVN